MPRFLFNPTNHYQQTEGGDAVGPVINSTELNIANSPNIDLGFIRKNTTNTANGVAGLDGSAKLNVNLDWSKVTTGKPITLAGYGIGDAVNVSSINAANGVAGLDTNAKLNVNLDWSKVTSGKPTTLDGYGISDGVNVSSINAANGVAGLDANAKLNVNLDWNKVSSGKPTTLDGYGISDGVNVSSINAANGVAGLDANAKLNVNLDWSKITTGKPTTLSGYGINDAINVSSINVANGVAGLDGSGKLANTLLPTGTGTSITGPVGVSVGQIAEYKIVPYSTFTNYVISAVGGIVTQLDDTITFTVTASVGGAASITVNGAVYNLTISAAGINTPSISSPGNNSTNIGLTPTFNSSQFSYTGTSQTQDMVRWELSSNSSFTNILQQYEGSSNLTSWTPSTLTFNTNYYIRVKHHSSLSGWSNWSSVVTFNTLAGTAMTGSTTVYTNQAASFTIDNYIAGATYNITVVGGTYTQSGSTISFTATVSAGQPASITLNGQVYQLTVLSSGVVKPTITSPTSNATNIPLIPTFTSSAFAYLGDPQTQTRVYWEIATSNSFGATVVQYYDGVNNLTSWTPDNALTFNTDYFVRVKHFSNTGGWSEWSNGVGFKTSEGNGLTGSTTVYTNQIAIFTIDNYVTDGVYTVTAVGGTVTRVNANISFTVTAAAGQSASITFNGRVYTLTVLASSVATPSITSHSNNATDVSLTPSFTSSAFAYVGAVQTQDMVRWELAIDSGFTTGLQFYEGSSNLNGWSPSTNLLVNGTYYLRVKYHSSANVWSEWSPTVVFSTIVDSSITGPSTVYVGQVINYTISNYSGSATYNISVVGGTYTRTDATITFTVTTAAGQPASITVNGTTRTLTVLASSVTTPSITSHSNNATDVSLTPNFTSSAFLFTGATQTQDMVRWELATDSGFTTGLQFYEGYSNFTSWTPTTILSFNTDYFLRIKHRSAISGWSAWSNVVTLHTLLGDEMTGPTTVYTSGMSVFTIQNYISGANYVISTIGGTYIRTTDGLVFTTTAAAGQPASITLNGRVYTLTVAASGVVTPNITSPVNNALDIALTPSFTSSAFAYVGATQTQDTVRWELATDSAFTTGLQFYEGTSNLTGWTPSSLTMTQVYYLRVKHHSAIGGWSEWSSVVVFSTIVDSSIIGPSVVYTDQTVTYTIGNYNSSTTYTITTQGGTFTRSGDTITYTVTTTPTGTASITVNGITRTLTVLASSVSTPSITSPTNSSTNVPIAPTFTSSDFAFVGTTQTQDIVRWEIATNNTFTTGLQFYEGSSNLNNWTPGTSLSVSSVYYARVKYHSALGGWSAWSTTVSFTTAADSTITGPTTVYTSQVVTYTINNYSGSATYTITTVGGSHTRSGNTITFTVTASAGGAASITINGSTTTLTVLASSVTTPSITSPANNATDIQLAPSFTSSAFLFTGATQTQDMVRWEIATDASFNSTVQFYEGVNNLTSWSPSNNLSINTTYHARVKYHSALGGWSAWSTTVSFTTAADSTITGPTTVYTSQVVTYTINNYSGSATYTITTIGGSHTRSGNTITFTVTASAGGAASITINGSTTTLTVLASSVTTPSITSPANNATDIQLAPSFTSSAFLFTGATQTQDMVRWEIATDASFNSTVQFYEGVNNLTSWSPSNNLSINTTYHARVKYHSALGGWSAWSTTVSFTTAADSTITGPTTVYTSQVVTYTINNYSGSATYTITSIGGSHTRSGNTITFTVTASAGGAASITINGNTTTLTVLVSSVTTPSITSHSNNATDVSLTPSFTSTAFAYVGATQTQDTVRWELATDIGFTTGLQFYEGTSNLTSWTPSTSLSGSATYYLRVKHHSALGGWSTWSSTVSFTTTQAGAILSGPTSGYNHQQLTITITNYNSGNTYDLIAVNGTYTRSGPTITFTIADSATGTSTLYINFVAYNITILETKPNTPVISSPSHNSTNISLLPQITSSAFISNNNIDTHYMTHWMVHKVSDNSTVIDTYTTSSLTSFTLPVSLSPGVVYRVKCRYLGHYGVYSEWSLANDFTTALDAGWVARLDGRSFYEAFYDSAVDASGNIYTIGRDAKTNSGGYIADSGLIAKWSPSGSLVWMYRLASTTEHSTFDGITIDASNNIYAVGTLNIGSGFVGEGLVTKWDINGNLIWQKTVSHTGGERYFAATCDSTGNVYTVGYEGMTQTTQARPFISKWSSSGTLLWNRAIAQYLDAVMNGAVCDASGNLIVVGRFNGSNNTLSYGVIMSIDPNGDLIWCRTRFMDGVFVSFNSVTCTTANRLYVTGYTSKQIDGMGVSGPSITKIDPADGSVYWRKTLVGAAGQFRDAICYNDTYVYAVGDKYNASGLTDIIITKWDVAYGNLLWQRSITTTDIAFNSLYSVSTNGSDHFTCAGVLAAPGGGYSQVVMKLSNDMPSIPNGALSGYGMTHISIGSSTLNTIDEAIETLTNNTIALLTLTYTAADRSLIKTTSDYTFIMLATL